MSPALGGVEGQTIINSFIFQKKNTETDIIFIENIRLMQKSVHNILNSVS